MDYIPPYTISNHMLELVSVISEKIGKIDHYAMLKSKPHLRRNNKIRSIHSSLKIEANSLSLSEVRDVIDGNAVLGSQNEVREVKNAYNVYRKIKNINPYSLEDLKKVHGMMTDKIINDAGDFRKGEEGVFSNDVCIFVAPPPNMVSELMEQLFTWMEENEDIIHPLIMSAIFHYEFVFIHPFSDGNGRMARFWHTVLLYNWREVFEYIPIESQIEKFQDEYYNAISKCHAEGNSNIFIEFMLEKINSTIDEVIKQVKKLNIGTNKYVTRLLENMEYDVSYTAAEIMEELGLKSKETFRKNYINPAIELGLVEMTLPEKPTSKNQRYMKK